GADAIDLARHNPEVTVVADLTKGDELPGDAYDCFVNQFTMHLIYDLDSALYHSLRVLKPGGVLLANFPSVEYCFSRGLDMGTAPVVLLYHRIAHATSDPQLLCVKPEHFAQHVEVVAESYQPVRLRDLVAALRAGELPSRAVAITFDDGYADNLAAAKPVLEQ